MSEAGSLRDPARFSNVNNYQHGMFNDYNYRPGQYAQRRSSMLCANYIEYNSGQYQFVLGQFYCPVEGFRVDATMCCGPPRAQYCCTPQEYHALSGAGGGGGGLVGGEYYGGNQQRQSSKGVVTIVLVFVVIAILACCVLVFVLVCVKKRVYKKLPMFNKNRDGNDNAPS